MNRKLQLMGCCALGSALLVGCGEEEKQASAPKSTESVTEAVPAPAPEKPAPKREKLVEETPEVVEKIKQETEQVVDSATETMEKLESTMEEGMAEVNQEAAEVAKAVAKDQPIDGESVYAGLCFSCHDSGLMDAPMIGNADAWQARVEQGTEVLYQSAINGKNLMPAKGGNPGLSDDEVKAAVDYMLSKLP